MKTSYFLIGAILTPNIVYNLSHSLPVLSSDHTHYFYKKFPNYMDNQAMSNHNTYKNTAISLFQNAVQSAVEIHVPTNLYYRALRSVKFQRKIVTIHRTVNKLTRDIGAKCSRPRNRGFTNRLEKLNFAS